MRPTAFAVALCGLMVCLVATTAQAQNNSDLRPLLDRLDRLERDMNMLQRQVYRGTAPSGAPVPVTPADSQSTLNYEVRISQLEDQMRTITGQIEEINYNLDQLKRRVETVASDVDQRLTALEHGGQPAAGAPPAAGAKGPQAQNLAGKGAGAGQAAAAGQPGVLGQLPGGGPQTAAAPADAGTLPSGTPQEQYNYAFGLLRQANYPAAEQALRSFIQRYPNDPLAGNAQYWLGETYYVRKDYSSAAGAFADGYRKYPKGGKAGDDLLKLGMSLAQLGQKADACRAFARLDRDFPTAAQVLKERANEEKKRLGC